MFFHSIHWSSPPSIFQLAQDTAPCFSQYELLTEEELKSGIENLQQYVKKISYLSMSLMVACTVCGNLLSSFILIFFSLGLDSYCEYINNEILNEAEDTFEKIKEKTSLKNKSDISTDWSSLPSVYQWLFGSMETIFPKNQIINKYALENGIEKLKKNIAILNKIINSVGIFTFGLSYCIRLEPCIALSLFCLPIQCYIKSVERNILIKAEYKQKEILNVNEHDFYASNFINYHGKSVERNIFLEVENRQKEMSNFNDFDFSPTESSCADQNLIVTA